MATYSWIHLTLLIVASLAVTGHAAPVPLDIPSWLNPLKRQKGSTLQDEIKCYSLPYGVIGFISHLLTFWVVLCLGFARRPYCPWRHLSAGKTDYVLSILQLSISVGITAYTIDKCRLRWQFMLIAIWKLVMSVEVGIFGLRSAHSAMKYEKYDKLQSPGLPPAHLWTWRDWVPYTLILYAFGAIVGMTGLMSIVWQMRHNLQIVQITAAFGSVTLFVVLVCSCVCCCSFLSAKHSSRNVLAVFFTFVLVCSLYSDWILGVIAGNLIGVPSGDSSVLYWTYFAAKRLPFFMT